jgi:PAS domain S-box-containing protein
VAESAVDGIVTTNLDGKIHFFNHSLEKIFGYHRAELTGKSLTTLMPDRYKGSYLKELERFKNSGYHRLVGKTVVTTGLKKNGTEFPLEMSLSSWKSGEKFYFTSIIRDLTSTIKAEEELQWSQERLMMGMDMASLAYWEYDIESDLFTFDDQFYALYGTTAEQEGGYQMTPQEYSQRFIPPEQQAIVAQEVGRALETDDPQFSSTAQHTIIRRDGEKRYIIVRIRVVMDKDGRKIGTRGVNQDITELKMAEKALKESDRRLADIIDFLPDATFVIDKMGRVISWNRAIEEMTGVRADEILGKGNYEYSIPFYGLRRPILVDMVKAEDKEIREHYQIPQRR